MTPSETRRSRAELSKSLAELADYAAGSPIEVVSDSLMFREMIEHLREASEAVRDLLQENQELREQLISREDKERDAVLVGDRIRFSVELLRDIALQQFYFTKTEIVQVVGIETEQDECKKLTLSRSKPAAS